MREVLENRDLTDRASLKLPPLVVAGAGEDEGGAGEKGSYRQSQFKQTTASGCCRSWAG